MSAWGRFDPLAKPSANDRSLRIVLKNPSIGHSSKNGFVDAFGLIGVQRACGEATKLARWQAPVQARRRPQPKYLEARQWPSPIVIERKIGVFQHNPREAVTGVSGPMGFWPWRSGG